METFRSTARGREELCLRVNEAETGQPELQWTGVGDLRFLTSLGEVREQSQSWLSLDCLRQLLTAHSSNSVFDLMLREVVLKALGEWEHPFPESELCHCRVVATDLVDTAILAGAHTPERVSRQTNASTQCGTCRPDVEAILAYRLSQVD